MFSVDPREQPFAAPILKILCQDFAPRFNQDLIQVLPDVGCDPFELFHSLALRTDQGLAIVMDVTGKRIDAEPIFFLETVATLN